MDKRMDLIVNCIGVSSTGENNMTLNCLKEAS